MCGQSLSLTLSCASPRSLRPLPPPGLAGSSVEPFHLRRRHPDPFQGKPRSRLCGRLGLWQCPTRYGQSLPIQPYVNPGGIICSSRSHLRHMPCQAYEYLNWLGTNLDRGNLKTSRLKFILHTYEPNYPGGFFS